MPRNLDAVTLAFDLDGTLIDTAPDLIATAGAVLEAHGFRSVPDEIIRPQISHGSRRMLERALEFQGREDATTQLDQLFADFLVHYEANISRYSRPFPEVLAVIARAKADGARIAICTNKLERPSRKLLDELEMTQLFDAIAGRDTYPVYKPNPGHLTQVVRDAGGSPDNAIMVGDSETDVATANAAQIPVIAVTFGYTSIPVRELQTDAVIDSYSEFDAAIEAIQRRRAALPPQ